MARKRQNTKRKRTIQKVVRPTTAAVTAIDTAPVSIGNSIRGAKPIIMSTRDGVRVIGREFMFSAKGTGSITGWTTVGGAPLCPAVFSDSIMRQYAQMYAQFRFKRLVAHYITASATSATGDVMLYYNRNRSAVHLNQSSSNLLPFVLSDPHTVLGPQWTNHSVLCEMIDDWKSTDYGMQASPDDYAYGDLFLLSKTSTTDSPGYVLFDYDIEFREMALSPRLNALPITRAMWFQTEIGISATAVTDNSTSVALGTGIGNVTTTLDGTTAANPTGASQGDIYKLVVDLTNSVAANWTNGSALSTVNVNLAGNNVDVALADGFTCYAVYNTSLGGGQYVLFPAIESAITNSNALRYSASVTITASLQVWLSYVTSIASIDLVSNM